MVGSAMLDERLAVVVSVCDRFAGWCGPTRFAGHAAGIDALWTGC